MDTLRPQEFGAENRERRLEDEAGFRVDSASLPSPVHPDRTGDAVLGDPAWIADQLAHPPHLETQSPFVDDAAIEKASRTIAQHAETLREKRIFAVLDGISGSKGAGTDAVAARLAGAAAAEHLSTTPTIVTTERAKVIAAETLTKADRAVREYAEEQKRNASPERLAELAELATTMDVVMFAEGADGGTDAVIAHCGDSRVYRLVAATGELELVTTDENGVGLAYSQGKIASREDYEAHASVLMLSDLPKDIRDRSPFKDEREFGIAGSSLMSAIGAGVASPEKRVTVARVAKGDKILICSDGVHDNLSGKAIKNLLKHGATALNIAKSAEGSYMKPDDVSLVVVEVGEISEIRKKRAARMEELGKKVQWAKSAATVAGADNDRVDALHLVARKSELALLELSTRYALDDAELTPTKARDALAEGQGKVKWMDDALAMSKLPPDSPKLRDRRRMRDEKAAEVQKIADLVAGLDRLEDLRKELG